MKIKLFILFIFSITSLLFCQEVDSAKIKKLKQLGLYPYPQVKDIKNLPFQESLFNYEPLSNDDINNDFSNISDLKWLESIAKKNKVLMLGEGHYFRFVDNIRNRILFYANTVDYYPLIVMEKQYSITPFINHYLNIKDDKEAEKYLLTKVNDMINTEEDHILLKHIRRWNKKYPTKKIAVGYSDIEHDYVTTMKKIIEPYFKKYNKDFSIDPKTFDRFGYSEQFINLKNLFAKAKKKNLIGDYPFITPQYISNVISNLEALFYATYQDFNYFRQKAIINNLTDINFLGQYLKNGKIIIHGGSYHTAKINLPGNGNFLREGSYLTFENKDSKNKTYSICFHPYARSLGEMANISKDSCVQQGSYYYQTLNKWQDAYKKGLITKDDLLFEMKLDDYDKLLLKLSIDHNNSSLLLTKIDWKSIMLIAKEKDQLYTNMRYTNDTYKDYDINIFMPGSPLTIANRKR
jgi:hypothetical protein